jgi:hypothetical protein
MIIVIVIITIMLLYLVYKRCSQQEGFDPELNAEHNEWDPASVGHKALDCYSLNKRDCMKYSNCGLCLKDGNQQCVPGDVQGPLFKDGCEQWMHTNYYDRFIFGERVLTVSPPWSKQYRDYEVVYPSPTSRATLL